jgi:hypothetical protein
MEEQTIRPPFVAIITDYTPATDSYSWEERHWNITTSASEAPGGSPRYGTDTAFELNGKVVAVGSYVLLSWRALDADGEPLYEFIGSIDTGTAVMTSVSKICPTFTTVSGTSVITSLTVEYQVVDLSTRQVVGTYCVTDPTGCCGAIGSDGDLSGPTTSDPPACCETAPASVALRIEGCATDVSLTLTYSATDQGYRVDYDGEFLQIHGVITCVNISCFDYSSGDHWTFFGSVRGLGVAECGMSIAFSPCIYNNQSTPTETCDPFCVEISLYGGLYTLTMGDCGGSPGGGDPVTDCSECTTAPDVWYVSPLSGAFDVPGYEELEVAYDLHHVADCEWETTEQTTPGALPVWSLTYAAGTWTLTGNTDAGEDVTFTLADASWDCCGPNAMALDASSLGATTPDPITLFNGGCAVGSGPCSGAPTSNQYRFTLTQAGSGGTTTIYKTWTLSWYISCQWRATDGAAYVDLYLDSLTLVIADPTSVARTGIFSAVSFDPDGNTTFALDVDGNLDSDSYYLSVEKV